MRNTVSCRTVVLGAGAMGSAAAYHLVRRGEPVTLVEQFSPGHSRGSSHGATRIIRHSYADLRYARMMPAAFQAWRELEADSGVPLMVRTGGVSFGPPGSPYVTQVSASLRELNVPHRRMRGEEWVSKHGAFGFPPDYDVVFEPDAGLVLAARAVEVMGTMARAQGAGQPFEVCVINNTRIERIDLEADRPTLITGNQVITAECLIVAAGAWVGKLLPRYAASLVPTHQQVLYFRPEHPSAFQPGEFPVFIFMGDEPGNAYYGMPEFLGNGVKVARHGGPPVDPDSPDRRVDDTYREHVRAFLRQHIPRLASAAIEHEEVCLYTMAPGDDFVVGPLPDRPDVILASPCSGHGFKFAPLVGRILADLATEGTTEVDISAWRTPAALASSSDAGQAVS